MSNNNLTEKPLVTCIITTYRRSEETLRRAINSIINQTYSNIELIIVDDNGVESKYHHMVADLINEINDKRISLISHETNMGVQRARNNGIKSSRGDYIALLDDDDEWLSQKIATQIKPFLKNPNLGIVYCWYNRIYEKSGNVEKVEIVKLPHYTSNIQIKLLRDNFIGSNSFPLLKKDVLEAVGRYDEKLKANQDWDMWIRMAIDYEVDCIKEPLVNYYIHQNERISNNPLLKIEAMQEFFKKYEEYFLQDNIALSNYYIKIAYDLITVGYYKEARKNIKYSRQQVFNFEISFIRLKLIIKSYVKQILG